jgi:hypothetical protein
MTSKPQNQAYVPLIVSVTLLVPSLPSILARSPVYWRTMMGLEEVPLRLLVKWPT